MESLHILNIIFASLPVKKSTGPVNLFFLYLSAEIFEFSFNPRCKIGCPLGHLDRVFPGYNLVRSDHPSKNKHGGVCIYHKASLPLRVIDICFLQECMTFKVMIRNKQCCFVALYRSPSQNQDEFDSFSKNLEITLDKLKLSNPSMLAAIRDFNAKSKNWYSLDRTTYEGNIIETITSHFGLHQLIHDPTHLMKIIIMY